MRYGFIIILLAFLTVLTGYSQDLLPVEYRVTKQAMSIPMTVIDEAVFIHRYDAKPVSVNFDGVSLVMKYDNNETFINKKVNKVDVYTEHDGEKLIFEQHYFVFTDQPGDTLAFVVDHEIPYFQLILPSENEKGNKVGYTSYRIFGSLNELASKQ